MGLPLSGLLLALLLSATLAQFLPIWQSSPYI